MRLTLVFFSFHFFPSAEGVKVREESTASPEELGVQSLKEEVETERVAISDQDPLPLPSPPPEVLAGEDLSIVEKGDGRISSLFWS